jgi:hypothetical protein
LYRQNGCDSEVKTNAKLKSGSTSVMGLWGSLRDEVWKEQECYEIFLLPKEIPVPPEKVT